MTFILYQLFQPIYRPATFPGVRSMLLTSLKEGARKGQNTSLALNRELKGQSWDWLPIPKEFKRVLTTLPLEFPNSNTQNLMTQLIDGVIERKTLSLEALDPTGEFSKVWFEVNQNIQQLFLGVVNPLTREFAAQQFFLAYKENAKNDLVVSDIKEFTQQCLGSYLGMLSGLLSKSISDHITKKSNDPDFAHDHTILLYRYYEELFKQLIEKTRNELIIKIEGIFAIKVISGDEKSEVRKILSHFIYENPTDSTTLQNMVIDIRQFYHDNKSVSHFERVNLFQSLYENYNHDQECMKLLQELKMVMKFSEPVESSAKNLTADPKYSVAAGHSFNI